MAGRTLVDTHIPFNHQVSAVVQFQAQGPRAGGAFEHAEHTAGAVGQRAGRQVQRRAPIAELAR